MDKKFFAFDLVPDTDNVTLGASTTVLRYEAQKSIEDPEAIAFVLAAVDGTEMALGFQVVDGLLHYNGSPRIINDDAKQLYSLLLPAWDGFQRREQHKHLLATAIKNKHIVGIKYHDAVRVIEPHTLGQEKLSAYQLRNENDEQTPPGWRLFNLSEITHVVVANTAFDGPRPGYKRGDRRMKTGIISEL